MKNSFALLTTLLLVIIFSFFIIRFVETNLLSSNLNSLKYLHLQALIYKDTIEQFILVQTNEEIQEYLNSWHDNRFLIKIIQDNTNESMYYYSIETVDSSNHVRLSQKIIK